MTIQRPLLAAGFLSVFVFACASDPNKQADDAHNAELKSERKQEQQNADNRSESRVNAAEVQRDNTEAKATGTSATKDRINADAKLTEARAIYRAKATERLEKADAKTAELKALVDKAGAKATTASRDSLKTVETHRTTVTGDLAQLPQVPNENWEGAKTSLDGKLDSLEALVKKAASDVDKFKK